MDGVCQGHINTRYKSDDSESYTQTVLTFSIMRWQNMHLFQSKLLIILEKNVTNIDQLWKRQWNVKVNTKQQMWLLWQLNEIDTKLAQPCNFVAQFLYKNANKFLPNNKFLLMCI